MSIETSPTRSRSSERRSSKNNPNDGSTTTDKTTTTDEKGELARSCDSIKVVDGENIISPIVAKARLTRMNVTHQLGEQFKVRTPTGKHSVNTETTSCTCDSSLPDRDQPCEHIQRVYDLAEKGKLTTNISVTTNQGNNSPESTLRETRFEENSHENESEKSAVTGREICCEECGREIGRTTRSASLIEYQTCNVCALDSHKLYHLSNEEEGNDDELVYLTRLLTSGTADSYYHKDSVMSVYEFFLDHPTVSRSDGVVFVHQRVDTESCSGMVFEHKETPVPNTIISKAQKKLSCSDSEPITKTQTDSANNRVTQTGQSHTDELTHISPLVSS